MKNKTLSKQQVEEDKETQRADKNLVPTDYHGSENTTLEGLPLNRPEEPHIVSGSREVVSQDMEIGDIDLDRMEAACYDQDPAKIPLHQVSLLEKVIIQAKNMNTLGVMTESLKVTEGKGKNTKKDKRGRSSNVQRIKAIGEQLVASEQYPTLDAALSPFK